MPAARWPGGQTLTDPVANAFTVTIEESRGLAGEVLTIAGSQSLTDAEIVADSEAFRDDNADTLTKAIPHSEAFSHTQTNPIGKARRRAGQRRR